MSNDPDISTTVFADDLIIMVKNKDPDVIINKLEELYIKAKKYYKTWKLRVNDDKSETILFRLRVEKMNKKHKRK